MFLLLSQFFAYIMMIWISVTGTVGGWLETEHRILDNAASVISASAPYDAVSSFTTEDFVSLLEVVKASLEKLGLSDQTDESLSGVGSDNEPVAQENLADAIVNIYCVQIHDRVKRTVSGTGFFINGRGVVLTNAHVGQYLLLEAVPELGEVDCYIRGGEGAEATYEVDLLYISPSWLIKHANLIGDDEPRGTGENDFALLYVTKAVNGNELPSSFPYLPPATSALTNDYKGHTVILAGYPTIDSTSEHRRIATTTITDLYTFKSGYADIFSLAASSLGHQGISGGPVIDHLGRAIGVITTKDEGTTILNAITVAHIDRVMKAEIGFDLISTTEGNLSYRAQLFNATVSPILRELLTRSLSQ